ncbi:coiled-coil domain-containing protein 8-like [Sycon ciliatum]|uniref:coiled-coil domain-containing protein 8-like n=1 Tax=Sycon ciliatum TaxID=27933 RepID=UPI0031F6BEFC
MGIVVGIAGDVAADAVADAAAEAAAEAAGEAAAEAAGEAAADAAAEAAAEGAGDAAAEAAGEAAGEAAAEGAVDAALDEAAGQGASQIVRKVIRSVIIVTMIEKAIRTTITIVEANDANGRIKKMLELLQKALKDAKDNMKTLNDQIPKAIKDGKLKETVKLPDGLELNVGTLFSAEMNSEVSKFLSAVQGPLLNVNAVATSNKKDIGKIEDAVKKAKTAFLKAADPFLATVNTWDAKDDAIKKEAGVDFHVAQLTANIKAIRDRDA